MSLDPLLLAILVDPEDKGPLWYFADEEVLYNPRSRRRYAVRDGIPVLLSGESETLDDAEAARFSAREPSAVKTGGGPEVLADPGDSSGG
ncbi:MAG TPA: Trm112 family protein [Acidimicrobiales bacterium]|nr:Trm112 family protein [Acidimicrobiales bacterium]